MSDPEDQAHEAWIDTVNQGIAEAHARSCHGCPDCDPDEDTE